MTRMQQLTAATAVVALGAWTAFSSGGSQAVVSAQTPAVRPADLVLTNGKIVTVEDAQPEVQAMAINGDTITALGTAQDISRYVGTNTKVIDLRGALATPGIMEAHAHFTGVGDAARNLKLAQANTWADIVRMVGEAAAKARPGEWIIGRGWHQEKWSTRLHRRSTASRYTTT